MLVRIMQRRIQAFEDNIIRIFCQVARLLTYIDAVANGETNIVFMRKRKSIGTPFVTIDDLLGLQEL